MTFPAVISTLMQIPLYVLVLSWLIDLIKTATDTAPGTQTILAISENGFTIDDPNDPNDDLPNHDPGDREHKSGMDVDIRINDVAAIQADIINDLFNVPLNAAEQQVLNELLAFTNQSDVPVVRIKIAYQRIADVFNSQIPNNIVEVDADFTTSYQIEIGRPGDNSRASARCLSAYSARSR